MCVLLQREKDIQKEKYLNYLYLLLIIINN
nr:MAG TPA: hypothetical protein [Bacteriophage sp.]